jgi:hypothetical protein
MIEARHREDVVVPSIDRAEVAHNVSEMEQLAYLEHALDHGAVRIGTADEALLAAFTDVEKTRLGPELDSLSGQLFAIFAEIAGAKCDSANTGIPEIRIGSSLRFRMQPLDQIKSGRAWIVAKHQERGAAAAIRDPQAIAQLLITDYLEISNNFESQLGVELHRAIEIGAIDVYVKDAFDHDLTCAC